MSDEFCIQISKFHTEILAIILKNRDYLVSKLSHHTLISWELCIEGLSTEEVGSLLNTRYETAIRKLNVHSSPLNVGMNVPSSGSSVLITLFHN